MGSGSAIAGSGCRISTKSGTLIFGLLDPGNPVDHVSSISIMFSCKDKGYEPEVQYLITSNDGQYPSGPGLPRMRNTTVPTEYLPYTLSFNPAAETIARKTDVLFTIIATVVGLDYLNAYVGDYEDVIEVYINP